MKAKNFITLILLTVMVASCEFCHEKELGRYDLTEVQKQLIPYEKGQVISFIDSAGEIINFASTKSKFMWLVSDMNGGGYCSDYITYRRKSVGLKSESNNFGIGLYIDAAIYNLLENYHSLFCIEIRPNNDGWKKRLLFYLFYDTEGNFSTDTTYTYFHDYLNINGKVYHNVVEQNHEIDVIYGKPDSPKEPVQLFYNKTYGILQINIDGKNFLTINN